VLDWGKRRTRFFPPTLLYFIHRGAHDSVSWQAFNSIIQSDNGTRQQNSINKHPAVLEISRSILQPLDLLTSHHPSNPQRACRLLLIYSGWVSQSVWIHLLGCNRNSPWDNWSRTDCWIATWVYKRRKISCAWWPWYRTSSNYDRHNFNCTSILDYKKLERRISQNIYSALLIWYI